MVEKAWQIADLKAAKMHSMLGVKPDDHEHLFQQVVDAMEREEPRVERARVSKGKTCFDSQQQYIKE